MKKSIILTMLSIFIFITLSGCARGDRNLGDSSLISNWVHTTGGKKYENPISREGSEYYNDGKKENVPGGIMFSGSGGYYATTSEAGAGCGGYYNVALDISEGFSIEFTVNTVAHKYDINRGGVWDSWISIGFLNKPEVFSNIADADKTHDFARGFVALMMPLSVLSNNSEISLIFHERGNEFITRSDTPIEDISLMGRSHTFELVKQEDELGVFYKMYFDGVELITTILASRFDEFFPEGKAYIQMYMQNWNASPKEDDTDELKNFGQNQFTVNAITAGDNEIKF